MRSFVVIALAVALGCSNHTGPKNAQGQWKSLQVDFSTQESSTVDSNSAQLSVAGPSTLGASGKYLEDAGCTYQPQGLAYDSANVIVLDVGIFTEFTCAYGSPNVTWTWTANVTGMPSGKYLAYVGYPGDSSAWFFWDSATVVVP